MERNYLICTLVGRFTALDPNISAEDLRYKIDEKLHRINGVGPEGWVKGIERFVLKK